MAAEKEAVLGTNPIRKSHTHLAVIRSGSPSARFCQRQSVGKSSQYKSLTYWGVGDLSSHMRDECQARDVDVLVFDEEHFRLFAERLIGGAHWVAQNIGAGSLADAKMIKDIANKIGATTYYIKTWQGKNYVIFKGYAGLRDVLRGTRYKDIWGNKKLLRLALGRSGLAKNGLMSGVWSVALVTGTNVIEFVINDELTWADLGANVTVDLGIAVVATAAGTLMATKTLAAGAVVFAVAPIAIGIVVSIGVGYLLGKVAQKTELRQKIALFFQKIPKDIEETLRKTNWWLNFLNTPEGLWWFQERLTWG